MINIIETCDVATKHSRLCYDRASHFAKEQKVNKEVWG